MKNILITGGSRGIGKEIVKICHKNNFKVHFTYSNNLVSAKKLLDELNSENISFSQCNLNNYDDIKKLFANIKERFDFLDGLVNNAGISGGIVSIKDFSKKIIDEVFEINVKGLIHCCKESLPMMSKNKGARGGSIVNISSMASTIGGRNGRTLYAASKGAIDVFTIGAAKELAQDGIRINAIRPGVIKTDLVSNELESRPELEKHYTNTIPMKRFGKPEEVSELALWLLSDSSSFVSGARIDVSGGGFKI